MAEFTVGGSTEDVDLSVQDIYQKNKDSNVTFGGNSLPEPEEMQVDNEVYVGTQVCQQLCTEVLK